MTPSSRSIPRTFHNGGNRLLFVVCKPKRLFTVHVHWTNKRNCHCPDTKKREVLHQMLQNWVLNGFGFGFVETGLFRRLVFLQLLKDKIKGYHVMYLNLSLLGFE